MWRRLKHLTPVGRGALVVGGLFVVIGAGGGLAYSRTQLAVNFSYQASGVAIKGPIKIAFSQEIDRKFNYNLAPGIGGQWRAERGLIGIKAISFRPTSAFEAGRDYRVTMGGMNRAVTKQALPDQTIVFRTESPSELADFKPLNQSLDAKVASELTLKLKSPNHRLRNFKLSLDPVAEVSEVSVSADDKTFSWRPKLPLKQGTEYHVLVEDQNQSEISRRQFYKGTFKTVGEPVIAEATNRGYFYPGDQITIKFAQAMKPQDDHLKFDIGGSGSWIDAQTYRFAPTGLVPGKSYGYRMLKGLESQAGGVLDADRNYQISTPGPVQVASFSPSGSTVPLNSAIRVAFDQPVNHPSAEARFSINPKVEGTMRWEGNTLVFVPAGLSDQAGYQIAISPGVLPVFGLPSVRSFSSSFTTIYKITKLNVPLFRQAYALSCEAASLRMALAYRGIGVTDFDILGRLNYAPRPRDTAGNSWDNPNNGFVGDVNGAQNTTGYGVHSGPIASAAQSFGRGATAHTGVGAGFIASQVIGGNPVIIWGYTSGPTLDAWNTSSGPVQAWKGEHTRVVYGVAGRADAPIGFYLNDPIGGSIYWTTSQLLGNLNVFGNLSNQAVVVN